MKIFNKYILTIFSILFIVSCDTQIDPEGQLSSDKFWKNQDDAYRALIGCYAYLDMSVYDAYEDGYADNCYNQYPWESTGNIIPTGSITDNDDFGYNYVGIRRFNYFLDNIDNVKMTEALKNQYKAEVKVLRANYYFLLISKFGSVPFFENYITEKEEALVAPTSVADIKTKILEDISESIQFLPDEAAAKSLINKAVAYTIKARIHMYYGEYAEAATASKNVISGGKYKLFKVNTVTAEDYAEDYSRFIDFEDEADKEKFYKGFLSYQNQFFSENEDNVEVILSDERVEKAKNYIGIYFLPANGGGGWSSITPTQELVNSYWTRTGTWFTPPTMEERKTRYNGGAYGDEYLEEFKNRDTRLYASIFFPGNNARYFLGTGVFVWQNQGNANNTSKTGYNFKKMVDSQGNVWNKLDNFAIIRYAEVLLNFAESQNEVAGPSQEIYDALNLIRERAGMPNVDKNTFGTKETLRTFIRNERRIELAGEGFRWRDMKRWKIGAEVMKNIYSINGGLAQERKWEDKFYLLPYPISAIDRNPNLKEAQQQKGY